MTPQDVPQHSDTGELWPEGGGAAFADVPSTYRSALAVRELRIARGETPRGHKIGFTKRTIWPRYNVYTPIWGSMWDTTVASCDGTGMLSLARLCQPRIAPGGDVDGPVRLDPATPRGRLRVTRVAARSSAVTTRA